MTESILDVWEMQTFTNAVIHCIEKMLCRLMARLKVNNDDDNKDDDNEDD